MATFTTYTKAQLDALRAADAASYAPRSAAVRVSAATLPTWTRKLQLSLLGQTPARLLCIGDSTTAGVYSDSYTTATGSTNQGGSNAYPARLAAWLTAHGIPAAVGMGIPGHPGNEDSRWSLNGGPGNYGTMGAGGNAGLELDAERGSLTFTPGVRVDTFRLYYFSDPGTGTLTAQATGGSTATITTSGGSNITASAPFTAGAASTSNVVTISAASGTCFLVGVEYWDSGNPNVVRVLPAGVGASSSADWATGPNTAKFGGLAFLRAVAADLTIVSLGINDAGAGRSAGQVLADVSTLAAVAAETGDVLLASAFPATDGRTDAVNAAYLGSTFPYVDLAGRYGHGMQARGLMTADGVHPNALGYSDAAGVVGRALATI